ncbi:gamma-glutamyl-gamma-aminobutyrate hydrolase family protein [Ilumatobacter sp.]|uniref:gamma-glutamyl-gamma-aminobutyrate hydrolase family protein n=1 Tax=Ilumatobacter sp. TaxID=1967498 RepID=UPI003C362D11
MAGSPAPLIGLPGRRISGGQIGYAPVLAGLDLDLYFADYARGVLDAGGIPVHLPLDLAPAAVIDRLDGIVLSGGADIAPARYGAEPHPSVTVVETERDDFEFDLLERAIDAEVPVLGICRGLQVLNVLRGGTLEQHVATHSRYDIEASETAHEVSFAEGSQLADVYGAQLRVNSLHHQTVDRLGTDLVITATSDDGVVEGLELGEDIVAVQWHPEMLPTRATDPIFRWLVERAAAHTR